MRLRLNDSGCRLVLRGVTAELAVPLPSAASRRHDRPAPSQSDRHRFEDLLSRHSTRLRRAAAGLLVDTGRLDDVLQDAYLKAFRALPPHFANEAHEAAWLHRVVYRTCLDELRSRRRRRDTAELIDDAYAATASEHVGLEVKAALSRLTPADREVILLVDLLGYDYATTAAVLHVPTGTVGSRLNKARAAFRRALDV
jgi:RNA polymerase sigma-70 factor, ECF subfamily